MLFDCKGIPFTLLCSTGSREAAVPMKERHQTAIWSWYCDAFLSISRAAASWGTNPSKLILKMSVEREWKILGELVHFWTS